MLNSILERDTKKITIQRLMRSDGHSNELILDKKEILSMTRDHYKKITDATLIQDASLNEY